MSPPALASLRLGAASGGQGSEAAVALLRGMLAIPSPSGGEAALASYLAEAMARLGLDPHIDGAGNVVGRSGRGDGPTAMLVGHMDTVAGELPVRTDGSRLFGRGAVDAKSALAAFVLAAAACRDVAGSAVVAGVVEEETPQSRGAVALARTQEAPDVLVVGEPSGWRRVVVGYRGRLSLRYRVERAPGHPASPCEAASEVAADFWDHARGLLGPGAGHESFSEPGVSLASIWGDDRRAELHLDVRTPPGFAVDAYVAGLRARAGGGSIDVVHTVPAVVTSRANPVVRALSAGIRSQGAAPRHVLKTGTSDMNTLAPVWDVPMATYGAGDGRLDHRDDEHIDIGEFLRSVAVVSSALSELLAGPGGPPTQERAR